MQASDASPATVEVLCAGAMKSAITEVARRFEAQTRHRLRFDFAAVGTLKAKLLAGQRADVAIMSRPVLDQLASDGRIVQSTIADLGTVGVGIAVRSSTALPDLSTPQALRQALLAAESIAYGDPAKGDSSGVHFASVLERLGIAQEVRHKSLLAAAGLAVAEAVRRGEAQIGATQATVILACEGIVLAGLLPPSLQHLTTYAVGLIADAGQARAATDFLDCLRSADAAAQFARSGLSAGN